MDALLLAVLNALWQGAAVIALVALALRAGLRRNATTACVVWSVAFVLIAVLPLKSEWLRTVRRFAFAALAALFCCSTALASASPASTFAGRWSIVTRSDDASRVQLRLEYSETSADGNSNSSWSSGVPTADAGLPIEKLRGPIGPVSFTIVREPGTLNCTGSAGEGSGAGQFTYAQNARFDDALASRGLGRPALHQSLELAISGTTLAFVDQIRAMAQRPTIRDIVRVVEHGITPKYIADMRAAGYTQVTADQLVTLRDHGVTVAFVERLKAHGYTNVSVHDLIRLRDASI